MKNGLPEMKFQGSKSPLPQFHVQAPTTSSWDTLMETVNDETANCWNPSMFKPPLTPKGHESILCIINRAVGNGIHFCDTTKRASQRLTPHIKGEIPLYHRSGEKPLDPTTLIINESTASVQGSVILTLHRCQRAAASCAACELQKDAPRESHAREPAHIPLP